MKTGKASNASSVVLERTRWALHAFMVVTCLAIVGQHWWAVEQDREQTIASESTHGLVAVRLLEEHATQTLKDAVQTLAQVAKQVNQMSTPGPAQVRKLVAAYDLGQSRYLKAVQFVSPDGVSWVSSPDYPTHQSNVTFRNDIQFLIFHPAATNPIVGHPYASRYDSQLVIPVSQNLFDTKGRRIGVISVDLRLSYFGSLYARVARENNASVALFSDDGFIIIRSPFEARYVDRDVSNEPALSTLMQASNEGSFVDRTFLDDDETNKLYTYRKLTTFPVTTVYMRDLDTVLAPWRQRTDERIVFAGVSLAVLIALTAFSLFYIRRLESAQSSLAQSESRFVSLFKQAPLPLTLVLQSSGRFIEANDAWLNLFGYRRNEVIGRTSAELQVWAQPDLRETLVKSLRTNGSIEKFEVLHRHKDGHAIECLMSGQYFERTEDPLVIFGLVDVTRQRAVEHEIREINQQLEERVQARTERLEAANQELSDALQSLHAMQTELVRSEKMAALGSLVAGVAHELNTPIGNSVTVGSTLQHQIATLAKDFESNNLRRSVLQQFVEAATHGTEILMRSLTRADQLISSFKRVAVDQSSDLRREFDLATVLGEVCLTLEPMYKNTPFFLTREFQRDVAMDSYPGALGQLVTNFVSNALQHGFEGRSAGQMHLAARSESDGWITLEFSDDGCGMTEETRMRVFDPFFTTKLGQGGSGLGMNIVYNIVHEVLGGSISVSSALDEGVTITVKLPVVAPKQEEA